MISHRPRLQTLIFEITQQCNHACVHCYNVWHGGSCYPRGLLDTETTIALLEKALNEIDCSHITLTGGEPLMRSDLSQVLEFLDQRGVRTTLISNGHLINDRTTFDLIHHGVDLFELPLLSHQRKVHDDLSGSDGAWDAVLEAMTAIRMNRGQFVAAFVATRKNIHHLSETIKLAFAFGARGLMFNRFNPGGRSRNKIDELLPSIEEIRKALTIAESAVLDLKFPISCSIPIQPCLIDQKTYPHLGFGYCAAGTDRAYYTLDPLGNLRPCNHSEMILGNLFAERFLDLTAPERLASFLNAIPPHCAPCTQRQSCQGGCKAAAMACYGELTDEEPFLRQRQTEMIPLQ